jgi:glycosyltransferase involved in cell wall biosynthesis
LRLTIVQYAGDYREAYNRLAAGGKETYHAQRYSVDVVGSLAQKLDQVCVICALSEEKYDISLGNGVRAIGAGLKQGFHPSRLIPELVKSRPTRISLTTPMVPILRWANANRVRSIVPLADSFQKGGLRATFRQKRLAYYLNRPTVEWVGNHGINACLSLLDIGVVPDKIVPWDWPPSHRPSDHAERTLQGNLPYKILYVGSVVRPKGVGDLLQAVSQMRARTLDVTLSIIGRDPDGAMTALSDALGLSKVVNFAGIVPNEDVPAAMRAADVVVIPSRHEYPEGLPLTIYEALAARTPIVASDHPMFRGALVHNESAVIFRAGDGTAMASALTRLLRDPVLYAKLSQRSEAAWNRLQLPVTMGRLLEAWISDSPAEAQWIRDHRLTSGRYDERIRELRAAR